MHNLDTASLALLPFLRPAPLGQTDGNAAILARAISHWVSVDFGTDWSASMFPPPGYRRMMRRFRLHTAESSAFLSMHPTAGNRLQAALQAPENNPAETLWATRFLLFLGFEEEAFKVLDLIPSDADVQVLGWSRQLHDFKDRWYGGEGVPASNDTRADSGEVSLLSITNRLGFVWRVLYGKQRDIDSARTLLVEIDQMIDTIPEDAHRLRAIASARTARYTVVVNGLDQKSTGLESTVRKVLSYRDAAEYWPDERERFVLHEATRRMLDIATVTSMREGWHTLAHRWAGEAVGIDPYCARAHLLLGQAEEALGDRAAAASAYRRAARLGILEREYAQRRLCALGEQGTAVSKIATPGVMAMPASNASSEPAVPSLPIFAQSVETAGHSDHAREELLRRRFSPFLDLSAPRVDAPLLAYAPLLRWQEVTSDTPPSWFETSGLQRAMVGTFRRELGNAIAGAADSSCITDFNSWTKSDASPDVQRLGELVRDAQTLESLGQSRLARVLCALGFFAEATGVLPPAPELGSPLTLEQAQVECTRFFIDSVVELGTNADYAARLHTLEASMPDDPRALRMRLSLCIAGSVSAARIKDIPSIRHWREYGSRVLSDYTQQPEVSEFEAALVTSRFYRGVSFLPFLTGDSTLLRSDLAIWLPLARGLKGADDKQHLLARENLFPALESAARTMAYLHEPQRTEALMQEIVDLVETLDSKAWTQVGELRQRDGRVREALEAYLTSARLAVPLGRVAWFKAGRCLEELGQPLDAMDCYVESLKLWPTGVTPAKAYQRLAHELGLTYESEWISGVPALAAEGGAP